MATLNRRQFMKSAAAAAAALSIPRLARAKDADARKPNIIFIMVDDMGYHDLGCFGSKTILTPNIDTMCAQGVKFTDCYSGDTVCAPARSTLMTGTHKGHTPVRGNSGGIPLLPTDVTVAEVLKRSGYATGAFGKWGLGNQGKDGAAERQGFDQFFVLAEHFLTGDIDERSASFFGARFSQHGNTGAERPPHHHASRNTEPVFFDLLRLANRSCNASDERRCRERNGS